MKGAKLEEILAEEVAGMIINAYMEEGIKQAIYGTETKI